MRHTKLYETLEINSDASENEIKKAYRKLAMKHHPDKGGDSAKFKEISAAFEILGNKDKKEKYDNFGITDDSGPSSGHHGGMDPMDIFSQMFGGNPFGNFQQRPRKNVQSINFNISLNDLYTGKDVKMKIERNVSCNTCNGTGSKDPVKRCVQCNGSGIYQKIVQIGPGMVQRMQGMCPKCEGKGTFTENKCFRCKGSCIIKESTFINVTISPGSENDDYIILQDKGDYIPDSKLYSDLKLILKQRNHSLLKRKGNDLYINYSISLSDAIFGIHIGYRHLDNNDYIFKLQKNTVLQYKSTYVARKMGMKKNNTNGDLYINFDIIFPLQIKNDSLDNKYSLADIKNMLGVSNYSNSKGSEIILEELKKYSSNTTQEKNDCFIQ